jgi:alkyl hydroperoxide reductase subunit AhpF
MVLNGQTNHTIVVESLLFANDKDETLTNGGTFDLIVIGTGTAASSAAFDCRL